MGIVLSLPRLERWLQEHAGNWHMLSDDQYKRLVADWSHRYRLPVARRHRHLSGSRALDAFVRRLPSDVLLFSGITVPEVANMGGPGAAGYRADALAALDVGMARSLELIIAKTDLSWCLLLSHEEGHEQLREGETA